MLTRFLFLSCSNVQFMATIKFLVQSKKDNAPVYCRLSIDRKTSLKRKTGIQSNEATLKKVSAQRSTLDESEKRIKSHLEALRLEIVDQLNIEQSTGGLIDGHWLESVIENHFGRGMKGESDLLTDYTKKFIENLNFRVSERSGRGVSEQSKKKYTSIQNKLVEFEKYRKRRFRISQVNLQFRKDFLTFLTEVDGISLNTAGRYIKFVKTFVLDAQKNGFEISNQMSEFRGFSVKSSKVLLSFDEIDILRNTTFEDAGLEAAKDWLIIGCYTGQRVSDLLRMNRSMIQSIKGFELLQITQQKTGKTVQIPIHPIVKEILEKRGGDFPNILGHTMDSRSTLFNRQIKEVCRLVGFNSLEEGKVYSNEDKKYKSGKYEKWQLVSSHICRRSFATNFYADQKYPTPLLMNITAHSTEKMFLEYIGKPPLDYSLQLANTWANEALSNNKQPQLKVVPNSKVSG